MPAWMAMVYDAHHMDRSSTAKAVSYEGGFEFLLISICNAYFPKCWVIFPIVKTQNLLSQSKHSSSLFGSFSLGNTLEYGRDE
jgi:hypothetical protein